MHFPYMYQYVRKSTQEERAKDTANSSCSANLLGSQLSGLKMIKIFIVVEHVYFSDF